MKAVKITFYPKGEAAEALKGAPPKKVSERVNELIMKGLSKEREEQMRRDYEQYDRELAAARRPQNSQGVSSTMMMSQRLFTDDEGSSESDQDLF